MPNNLTLLKLLDFSCTCCSNQIYIYVRLFYVPLIRIGQLIVLNLKDNALIIFIPSLFIPFSFLFFTLSFLFFNLLLLTENVLNWAWIVPERFRAVLVSLDRVQGADEFESLAEGGSFGEVSVSWLT